MFKELLHSFVGETMGTFIVVFFGCSTVAVTVLFSAHGDLLSVAAVWGVAVTLGIYSTRFLSCAHLNPAVSLAMVVAGRMKGIKLPVYWGAQFCGAIIAGGLLYLLFSPSIIAFELANSIIRGTDSSVQTAMIFGEYFPNPGTSSIAVVTPWIAFCAEALGTGILVLMIFLLTEGCNVGRPTTNTAPIIIGLTVTALICILAPLTQAGLNPARDFGPRLIAFLAGWGRVAIPGPGGGFFWVYILGPFAGGCISALIFRFILQPLMLNKDQAAAPCGCKKRK